ncbi:hypothetical protein VCRA2120E7_410004 [Vibrio crassostreae]|nr:hypothetical protein VCRA2110O2_450004 [Vibrio crassostreae]CAK3919193.1 hypothetical protein VCRA2120E7_410004 [Vibrio crassostreae]
MAGGENVQLYKVIHYDYFKTDDIIIDSEYSIRWPCFCQ